MDNLLQRVRLALADSYDIRAEVGRGGMAVVYRGTDLRHDRSVAVKVLPPHLASAVGHERFLQEIQVSAGLSHPYILPLLDSGQADGLLYYVMPFVEGESLRERLARDPQLPIEDALRIADETAQALGHAHALGVVHRDVKPSNILLTHDHALLADFGVAFAIGRGVDVTERLTGTGLSIGTPAYMSPQQGLADEFVDGASDQYSLACVLYEMLAGRSPFAAPSPDAVLRSHVMDTPPLLRSLQPAVPAAVEAAVARALSKSPDDRFPSMEAFAAALRAPDTGTAPDGASLGRRAWLVAGSGLLLFAAVFGLSTLGGGNADAGGASYQLALLPCQAAERADSILGRNVAKDVYFSLDGYPTVNAAHYAQTESWATSQAAQGIPLSNSAAAAREHLGASAVGICRIEPVGADSIDVSFQVFRQGRPRETSTVRLSRTGERTAHVDPLVIELAGLLSDGSTSSDFVFRPTDDQDAWSYFLEADGYFLQDRLAEAETAFGQAADIDPTFALARWRQADARRWQAVPGLEHIEVRRLFEEHGGRLGTRDSLLLSALVETPGPAAFEQFERVLERLPGDAYATLLYGDELLHRGPLWGVTLDSVENVLTAATRLNPDFAPAWDHLAQVRIRLGMEAEAAAAVEQLEELASPYSPENPLPLAMIWRHGWLERFDPVAADTSRLKLQENMNLLAIVARLVRYGDLPRGQLELGEALINHPDTKPGDAMWHSGVNAAGLAYASLGRPEASLKAFSAAADLTPAAALLADQWAVVPVALGLEGYSETVAMEAARRLAEIATEPGEDGLRRARAAWTLALLSSPPGGYKRWRSLVDSLSDSDSAIVPLVRHLDAVAFARAERWSDAIDASRSLIAYDSVGNTERPFARSAIYLTRGSWFEAAGQTDSAVAALTWHLNTDLEGVPDSGVQASEVDGAFGTHARLRIARLTAQTGHVERACSEASEVVRRWEGSDPILAQQVAEALQIVSVTCPP